MDSSLGSKKLLVGNLPFTTTSDALLNHFSQFGEVETCVICSDKITGKSRGFGFVTFKESGIADNIWNLTHIIDNREALCKVAVSLQPKKENTIFLGGIPETITQEKLQEYFGKFGKVSSVDLKKGKGYGFVIFESASSVNDVIAKYTDIVIDGKWIECKRVAAREDTDNTPMDEERED